MSRGLDIIENWGLLEADFQREYNINLMASLWSMTWRRFLVLLQGLSSDSALVNKFANDGESGQVISDQKTAERILERWNG